MQCAALRATQAELQFAASRARARALEVQRTARDVCEEARRLVAAARKQR